MKKNKRKKSLTGWTIPCWGLWKDDFMDELLEHSHICVNKKDVKYWNVKKQKYSIPRKPVKVRITIEEL